MLLKLPMAQVRLWWESITPLGCPVEPLVYITIAMSSGPGGQDFLVTMPTSPFITTSSNRIHLIPSGTFLGSIGLPARSSITTMFLTQGTLSPSLLRTEQSLPNVS